MRARESRSGRIAAPIDDPLEKIEGRWTLQILLCLNAGERRFSDLRAAIPRVSANILADRLRSLESAGLVERHHLPPPYASRIYLLTGPAAGLRPALDALANWRSQSVASRFPHNAVIDHKSRTWSDYDEAEG